jgi:hypothetical protein
VDDEEEEKDERFDEIKVAFLMEEEEDSGPYNLADLRISIP